MKTPTGLSLRSGTASLLAALAWLAGSGICDAADPAPLRRAFVPADRTDAWPTGAWERVPFRQFAEFERSRAGDITNPAPAPVIDRMVFRATLTAPSIIVGRFEAHVRLLDDRNEFLELGSITPAIRDLQWTSGPAIWGTAPDGSALLHVDRADGQLTGEWSLHGESVLDELELDLQLFPAAAARLELTLPEELQLQCSRGVVLAPEGATDGLRTWIVELGQSSECLCRVVSNGAPSHAEPSYEGIASYTIRPDGCRLQSDFNISVPSKHLSDLRFVIPPGVENPEVTTATSVGLPAQVEHSGGQTMLIVPLPERTTGRLGTIRIVGDLALHENDDWVLPVVRLQGATELGGLRRVHVERPLTLQSFDLNGMRQTGIDVDEGSGTWLFEDLSSDASLTVRIGRPPASVSLRGLTLIEYSQSEARFQSVVSLLSRGENIYRAKLRLPAEWSVVEVGVPPGQPSAVTSWRVIDGEPESLLEIDFRQALSSHSPRQVLISGRCVDAIPGPRIIKPFPRLSPEEEARVMLAIRGDTIAGSDLKPHGGLRSLAPGEVTPEWASLGSALRVSPGDPQFAWFVDTGTGAEGSVSAAPSVPEAVPSTGVRPTNSSAAEFSSNVPMQIDLHLESNIGSRGAEWHRHRAVFLLSGKRPESPPKIRLPAGILLDGVSVDGRAQNVVAANDALELLDWPESPRRVEIRYRSRVADDAGWLSRTLHVPLPEWDAPPRELDWRLHLPRTERIAEVRVPRSTVAPRPGSGWTQWPFGPLARENWLAGVNPFSLADGTPQPSLTEGTGAVSVGVLTPDSDLNITLADVPNGQRAGWFSMFAACMVTSVLRLRSARGRLAGGCGAVVLVLAAVTLPDTQAVVWGGALLGTLLGTLLPQSWLRARPIGAVRLENSGIRRSGAAAGVSVLVACLLASGLPAQSPDEQERESTPPPENVPPEFDVLIPMHGSEQAGDVWIQRRLLPAFEAWHGSQQRNPAWLLQAARYQFQPGAAPRLHAEFDVAVFDRRSQVMLALPFGRLWVPDPDACRINDQPGQIRPSADSGSLLVALPGLPAGEDGVPSVRVSLELQPSADSRIGGGWEFDIPPVLNARLSLPPAGDPESTLSTWSQRGPETDDQGERVFELGAVSVLALQAASAESQLAATARWTFDAMSLIEVHPLRLRIRTQLTSVGAPRWGDASASQWLRLLLPGRSDVPVVAVEGLRSYSVRYPQPETTLLELELDRQLPADTAVHIDFTVPAQMSGSQVIIPALEFLEGGQLRSHRIGLRAAPGVELEPPPAAALSADLREMPIAVMFSAGLSNNSTWPVPSHVYLAAKPAPIEVSIVPIDPVRSATLEQSLVVGDGLLQWQATAVIDVPVAPLFKHEFLLAPEVRLDSVDVQQDGASRLLNWTRHDDRLVLYLPGDRTGRQEVHLSGVMPFKAATTTALPAFGLLDTTITASELIIQSPQARRLDLIAADGAALSTGAATATDAGFIRRFSQQDAVLPVAFRSEAAPALLSVGVVTSIERHDSEWRWNTEFQLDRPLTEGEFLVVGMPRELVGSVAPNRTIVTPDGEAGGVLRLLLHSTGDAAGTNLGFSTQLEIPDHGEWTAPRIELLNATVSDQFVVVPPEFPFVPLTAAATTAEPASWPAAFRQNLLPLQAASVYRWTEGEARFTERRAEVGAPVVRFMESALWPDQDGSTAGVTTFWVVAAEAQSELQFPWPGTVRLQRVLWDGKPLEASTGADETLRCRVEGLAPGSVHRLSLEWVTAAGTTTAGALELWRPQWTQSPDVPEIAAVFPREGHRLYPRGAMRDRPDALQQRAAALLDMYKVATPDDRQWLATEIESTASALQAYSSTQGEGLVARWAELQAAPEVGFDTATMTSAALGVISTAICDEEALLVTVPDGVASLDIGDLHSGSTLAAVIVALLLAIVLLRRFRQTWNRAVTLLPVNVDAANVAVLGVLWWLCLKVSVIGLVLLIVAAVLQWKALRRPAMPSPLLEA